jgi:glutathionylspermidine synthase
MVALVQLAPMVDNRLLETKGLSTWDLGKEKMHWLVEGENHDYIAPEVLRLNEQEMENYRQDANKVYDIFVEAAKYIGKHQLWEAAGIPPVAIELVEHSLNHELGTHLIGRFDYAGGLGDFPMKVIEFNGDTFSLLPESTTIQRMQFDKLPRKQRKHSGQFNLIMPALIKGFQQLLDRYPDKYDSLLISGLGHEEDELNLKIIETAAKRAGFAKIDRAPVEEVIFSTEEGIFLEYSNGTFQQFDFWFKMAPWEFIAYEEPELMEMLTSIVKQQLAVVINPAYSMLFQSKGILPFLQEVAPGHPSLLQASLDHSKIRGNAYAAKPMFGRTGDNVQIFTGSRYPIAETQGDFGHLSKVYQELAQFERDEDGDIYQPSVFWAGGSACGFCLRRQDSLIVDDDAEFVGHILQEGLWSR